MILRFVQDFESSSGSVFACAPKGYVFRVFRLWPGGLWIIVFFQLFHTFSGDKSLKRVKLAPHKPALLTKNYE